MTSAFPRRFGLTRRAALGQLVLCSAGLKVHAQTPTASAPAAPGGDGKPLRLAVAANFAAPLQDIATAFEAATGHAVVLSSGSTGKLYAQIVHGAPFDALFSADVDTPARLEATGLTLRGTRFTYAIGALVLWSATPGRVDAQGAVLGRGEFRHLALANPKTAPYGAAALQTLQALGLHDRLKGRLVQGESIAQTFQFVASGNAELGFVALSQLQSSRREPSGSLWRVPAGLHAPLRQDAVLLTRARGKPAAQALWQFLKSDAAQRIVREAGYQWPAPP